MQPPIALGRVSVHKWPCGRRDRVPFPFTRNLPSVGLSGRTDPLTGIRQSAAMHKILLAEDDNDMRRFLVKALETAGFQVSPHDNGLSAYQRLREEPFEMLLTDIVMPEMDGIELARRASELDPDIKIMFITGFAADIRTQPVVQGLRARSSAGEHLVDIEGVTGSIPVAPTIK